MQNTPEQEVCIDLSKLSSFKVEAVAGSGKEQPISCKVQTPDGPKNLGDITVGDSIFNTYGGISSVVGVFPQGVKASYKVTFRDGTHTNCGLDHLWELVNKGESTKIMSLREILDSGITKANGDYKHQIKLTHEVNYRSKNQKIDPYLVGLLLGDGYLVGNTTSLSVNADDTTLVKAIKDYCISYNLKSNFRNTSKKGLQTTLVPINKVSPNASNWLKEELKVLGLNVKSGERYIPKIYLEGSVEQRKQLLRGIMDSDGSCVNNRTSFSTTSKKLLRDVKTLVQSLGGVGIERSCDAREGKATCYSLNIKTFFNPFGYSCKGLGWKLSSKNPPLRYITDVQYVGQEEQVCIKVDANDSLYLTDNFIVTHNTTTVRLMAEANPDKECLYLAFNKSAAEEAASKMPNNTSCRTTHSIAYRAIIGTPDSLLGSKLKRPQWNPNKYVNAGGTVKEIAKLVKATDVVGANRLVLAKVAKQTVSCFEASSNIVLSKKHIPLKEINKLNKKAEELDYAFSEDQFCRKVMEYANILWEERINPKSPVVMTHDTYLKLYQLLSPTMAYDVIFLDEAQDTSDCVIDIVSQQEKKGARVIAVGDTYQSIYGWRGAVNALSKINTKSTSLSQSWRYGQQVADVASFILDNSVVVKGCPDLNTEVGLVDTKRPYTQLFRTNIKLIQQGVKLIREGVRVRMQVDYNNFVKMLSSMIALKHGDTKKVKHEEVLIHSTWGVLLEEASVVKGELKLLSDLVEKGNPREVLSILSDHEEPNNPHVILTTAHKSKGMEYDQVILAEDFMDVYDGDGYFLEPNDMERNLLYVAVTRAKKKLQLNKTVKDIIREREKLGFNE